MLAVYTKLIRPNLVWHVRNNFLFRHRCCCFSVSLSLLFSFGWFVGARFWVSLFAIRLFYMCHPYVRTIFFLYMYMLHYVFLLSVFATLHFSSSGRSGGKSETPHIEKSFETYQKGYRCSYTNRSKQTQKKRK